MLHGITQCYTTLHRITQCCIAFYCITQCCIVLHNVAPYYTMLHNVVHHITVELGNIITFNNEILLQIAILLNIMILVAILGHYYTVYQYQSGSEVNTQLYLSIQVGWYLSEIQIVTSVSYLKLWLPGHR